MGINFYLEQEKIDFLPDSPFKKKIISMNDRFIHPVIDRNNPTLQFIVGNFSKEEYSKYIDMGYVHLAGKMKSIGYKSGGGFHPCTYGIVSDSGCIPNSCDAHHQLYKKAIMSLWDDETYVRFCIKKYKKRAGKTENAGSYDTSNPEFRYIMSHFTYSEFGDRMKDGGWMDVFNELKGNGIHIYGGFCPRHYGFLKQVCKTDCNTCHMNAIKEMKPYFKHRSRYV